MEIEIQNILIPAIAGLCAATVADLLITALSPGEALGEITYRIAMAIAPLEIGEQIQALKNDKTKEGRNEELQALYWGLVPFRVWFKLLLCSYCMTFWLSLAMGVSFWVFGGNPLYFALVISSGMLFHNFLTN